MKRLTVFYGLSKFAVFEDYRSERIFDGLLQVEDVDGATHTFAAGYWRRLKFEEVEE